MVLKWLLAIVIFSTVAATPYAYTTVGYYVVDSINDYRTWSVDYWRDMLPDLNIPSGELDYIMSNRGRLDLVSIEAEYVDEGYVEITFETTGEAFSQGEVGGLAARSIYVHVGGIVKFTSPLGVMHVRVNYEGDVVDEDDRVDLNGYIQSRALPRYEEEVPITLTVEENKYVFRVTIPDDFKPLNLVDEDVGAVITASTGMAYYLRETAMKLDFLEDTLTYRYEDFISGDRGQVDDDIQEGPYGDDVEDELDTPVSDEDEIDRGDGVDGGTGPSTGAEAVEGGGDTLLLWIGGGLALLALAILGILKFLRGG